jgi:hypothetical protein
MAFKLATRIISVPAICEVPTTRSPFSTFNAETIPLTGAKISVLVKFLRLSFKLASKLFTV